MITSSISLLFRQLRIMMLYRPLVVILTIILHIYKEETHIVSTKNLINQITYNSSQCKQTRGLLNINFVKELELDKYLMLFYHLKHSRRCPLSIPVDLKQKHHRIIIIMKISGDISVNPGPVKHPCGGCQRPVAKTHRAVQCDVCYYWWHIKCANISPATYTDMCGSDDPWVCNECNYFRFSESFFDKSICVDMDSDNENENVDDIFDELKDIKKKHPNISICSYININSFRNKFGFIKDLLISNTCDMLTIAETKLDESFNSAQFQIENFHLWRAHRTANGGGLLTYIRSDLPSDKKHKLECQIIESIFTEIVVKNEPEALKSLYSSPGNKKNQLVLCKNYVLRHLGITINIKNTKFVKDRPMIDAQFRFNQCNSFREEYISVFSHMVLC